MKLYYRPKVTITCSLLVTLMLCASYWQYTRYIGKQGYIATMQQRLAEPIVDLETLLRDPATDWSQYFYRKVQVSGTFEFPYEMVLRNRRYEGLSGVFALTPLRLSDALPARVLVSRGFVPLAHASREDRKKYQTEPKTSFVGLVKESAYQKWLAPSDPATGQGAPWADAWLRVDIPRMESQLPFPLLPFFLEVMESGDTKGVEEQIVSSTSGRDELFFLGGKDTQLSGVKNIPDLKYPAPIFDTVIPAGRHFGYIFEWALMALITTLAGIVLQLKPRAKS
jgi:cytochrome oxidase assembly protein ShyY1